MSESLRLWYDGGGGLLLRDIGIVGGALLLVAAIYWLVFRE